MASEWDADAEAGFAMAVAPKLRAIMDLGKAELPPWRPDLPTPARSAGRRIPRAAGNAYTHVVCGSGEVGPNHH